jgi:RNAse (barnase) inhibitor barstar
MSSSDVFSTLVSIVTNKIAIHPLKSDFNNKDKKVFHGNVYASTMRMLEDIKKCRL